MIPVLHDRDNITNSLGKGKLTDIISCEVYEELNGEFTCEFQYPVSGVLYEDLMQGGTIQVVSPNVDSAPVGADWFDIYKHTLPIDGVVTFYATHISRRLADYVYAYKLLYAANMGSSFHNHSAPTLNWTGTDANWTIAASDMTASGTAVLDEPKSLLACLLSDGVSYVTTWGGEVYFGTYFYSGETRPTIIIHWNQQRGSNKGVQIRYGYSMIGIESTSDASGTYNAVVPYWVGGDGDVYYVTGYIVQPTTPITPIKAAPLNLTDVFETKPTNAQMTTYAQNFLDTNMPWLPAKELTGDFINGSDIGLVSSDIQLGDTVRAIWRDAGVSEELRCVSYRYDVLAERYIEMRFGKKQENFVAVTGYDATGGGGAIADSKIRIINNALTATISIPDSTVTNVGSYTFPKAGKYFLNFYGRFANNATGRRSLGISTSSTTLNGLENSWVNFMAAPSNNTAMQVMAFIEASANQTIYFNVYHEAGASLNFVQGHYNVIEL